MFAACSWNSGPWGFQTLRISSRHLPSAGNSTGYNVKSTWRHKAHQEFSSYFFNVFLKTKVAPPFFPPVSKLCVKYGLTTLYMKVWNKLRIKKKKCNGLLTKGSFLIICAAITWLIALSPWDLSVRRTDRNMPMLLAVPGVI